MILSIFLGMFVAPPQDSPPEARQPAQTTAPQPSSSTNEDKKSRWLAGTSNFRDLAEAMGSSPLLKVPAIQAELELTALQKEKLNALLLERDKEYMKRAEQLVGALMIGQRKAKKDGVFFESPLDAVANQYKAATSADVKGVLNPKQYRRSQEIQVQLLGPVALLDPEVQDRINLWPDTRAELAEVYAQYRRERLTLLRSMTQAHLDSWKNVSRTPGATETSWLDPKTEKTLDESAAKIDLLEKRLNREIFRRLTKKQRETYRNMAGEPVALKDLIASGGSDAFTPNASLSAVARAARDKAAAKSEPTTKKTGPSTDKK